MWPPGPAAGQEGKTVSELLEALDDGVLTLTLNRPDRRNAMVASMMAAFTEATIRAAADPAVRCLVVTGAGRAFCAGGDVDALPSDAAELPEESLVQVLRQGMEANRLLHEMPKPTLAVIPGAAAGAGLSLALSCDLRFCLDTAKLTTAFAKIGASGDSGISYFLPRLVGDAKARELMFSSDVITGQEALALGLVTKVASADDFDEAARAYARHLAGLPTIAIGYMKRNLNASHGSTLSEVLDLEAAHMIRTLGTDDHHRAVAAFQNKSEPRFEGR